MRVPSGVSYVLSNRRAMSQMFPDMFGAMGVRPVLEYSQRLRSALTKAAPEDVDDPTIVVLTPGRLQLRVLRALAARAHHGR